MNNFQSLVERKLIPVGKSGHDIIYICPYCDDKSGHLWVNYHTNKFHCFKCDKGGKSIVPLINKLGIDIRFDYETLETLYTESLNDIISGEKTKVSRRETDYSKNLKTLTTYFNYHTSDLTSKAREYLNNRGLSDTLIQHLCIREGINRRGDTLTINGKEYECRDYSGRVMVPSLQRSGTISYYVARDYIGDKHTKYLNPPKTLAYSSEDVYNLDNLDSEYVIICEGVFSAISIISALGKNVAVATYGKSISARSNSDNTHLVVTSQGEKLLRKKFSTYYVFYDKDAIVSAMNTCNYLYDRGVTVRLVKIPPEMYGPHADAGDMTREEIITCIKNSEIYTRFTSIEDLFN